MFCTTECFSKFPRQGPAEGNCENHSAVPKVGARFGSTQCTIQVHVENHKKLVKANIKYWDPKHTENTIFKSCVNVLHSRMCLEVPLGRPPYHVMRKTKSHTNVLHTRMFLEVPLAGACRGKLRATFCYAKKWRKLWFYALRDTSSC